MKLKPLYSEQESESLKPLEEILDLLPEDDEVEYPEYDDVPPAF
jgi:hypothetical protein